MGFSKDLPLFAHIAGVLRGNTTCEKPLVQEFAFEAADAMECGLAREPARCLAKPEQKEEKRKQMTIDRSDDLLRYTLRGEDGAVVISAHTTLAEGRVEFVVPGSETDGPAFTMTFDESTENWQLCCPVCDACAYKSRHCSCEAIGGQVLANMKQSREQVGGGTALCMDLEIPKVLQSGNTAVWCPLNKNAEADKEVLPTLRPSWNKRIKSLVMDFKGRATEASSKNIQICRDGEVVMVFGKRGPNTFCLDFEHPLSPLQAFAAAISTMFWN